DISRLELLAIVLGLLIVGEIQDESGGECTILSDNTAAIHVRAFHVPGVSNEISDGLSRGVRPRQRVARALGRRVPVSKFIERLLGASVGELPAYFTVSEEEELLGVSSLSIRRCVCVDSGSSTVLPMDPHIAGKVAQVLELRCPKIYGGASSRLELAEASEVQSVAVRPAVKSGGVLRSSFTHPRHRNGSGSEPYALRPSVRVVGSKSRGIPTVSTDTMSMVLAAARAPSTNRKYT
ncbi:hypothetical protein FOZ61_003696, partial [Perkinsus olseni]